MRKGVKVAAWAAVFLACAGVGAYIAAHSDPFPPGVDRPGATGATGSSASPSTSPQPVMWAGNVKSVTYHELYVGGRCTTRWRGKLRFTADVQGEIDGSGQMRLLGTLRCDFPIAQTQVRRIELAVHGRILPGGMALRLAQLSIDPTNGRDFGGFGAFLPFRTLLATKDDAVNMTIDRRRVDEQGRGTYSVSTTFDLHAVGG
jgi:hypothetical protein